MIDALIETKNLLLTLEMDIIILEKSIEVKQFKRSAKKIEAKTTIVFDWLWFAVLMTCTWMQNATM